MQKIIILGTGGTIAGSASSNNEQINYQSAQISVEDLFKQSLNSKTEFLKYQFICEQVAQIDSKDMNFAIWQQLLQRCQYWLSKDDVSAIVITHGTDTIEESCFFLHLALPKLTKPIVFTCAMLPATAKNTDGPANLTAAIKVACECKIPSVMLVHNAKIHHPQYVQKISATRLESFSSEPNQLIGKIVKNQINWNKNFEYPVNELPETITKFLLHKSVAQWPKVEIYFCYVQSSLAIFDYWLLNGLDGVVIAATGNATISKHLEQQLKRLEKNGVTVWLSSRCAFGGVIASSSLAFPISQQLAPFKARIALLLKLIK